VIKKDDALLQAFDETRDYFVAFGDRYRQEIIVILAQHPQLTVKELAEKLHLSRPATSHHIKILRDAGMLGERRDGVKRYYYPTLQHAFLKVKQLIDDASCIME